MIKDFVPARTSLASGIVVKQHLLERNKYPQPQVSFENKIYTASIDMVKLQFQVVQQVYLMNLIL